MKVLLVGGGGREHALAWKLARDLPSLELIAAPGNPGIAEIGRCVAIAGTDINALIALARTERVAFTIVGPEAPLAAGLVDEFRASGLAVFGPTQAAAQMETSKAWAKSLMVQAGVPTAAASLHTDVASARAAAHVLGAPVVIKASGLAAGKGVIVAMTMAEAERAIEAMLEGNAFGEAGHEVLVEEFMTGEEISLFGLTDGTHVLPMLAAQDHKRLLEGDAGPNTGGMGSYAPVSTATPTLLDEIQRTVFAPTLAALRERNTPFTGLLYAGLMLTPQGPKVVEFNCRFGDPETQVILPMVQSNLAEVMHTIAAGESLAGAAPLAFTSGAAVGTVIAAAGYPDQPTSGATIDLPASREGVTIFHAGTKRRDDGALVSSGGRVLTVVATATTFAEAQRRSAEAAAAVRFDGAVFRRDIGWREAARIAGR
jgi:phosphoribosylamine--glycine ligase